MIGYKLFCCLFLVYVNIFFLNGCAENIAVSNRFEASVAKPVQEDELFIPSVKDKHLKDVLSLVFKTDIGRSFEPEIKQLLRLNKIKLVAMSNGHFGESGEGCVIKQGRYFFEGFFIELNKFYSTSILATSLVHELAHYKIIKNIVQENASQPIKISWLEVLAFDKQFQFIKELEKLKLIRSGSLFTGDKLIINQIMQEANALVKHRTKQGDDRIATMLNWYGYSRSELNRVLVQRSENKCYGLL